MSLQCTRVGRCLFVTGELDASSVPAFHLGVAEVDGLIDLLDLAGVSFVDSAGVSALVTSRRRYPNVGMVNASATLRRLLDTVGLRELVLADRAISSFVTTN